MLFTSLYQKWFSSCLGLPAMSAHLKDDGRLEDGSQEGNSTLEDVSSDGSYLADGLNWGKELKNWVHTLNSSGKDFFRLGKKKTLLSKGKSQFQFKNMKTQPSVLSVLFSFPVDFVHLQDYSLDTASIYCSFTEVIMAHIFLSLLQVLRMLWWHFPGQRQKIEDSNYRTPERHRAGEDSVIAEDRGRWLSINKFLCPP